MTEESGGRGPAVVDRVVFFSDAVFAIAITLLVIDLRLPELASSGPSLWEALWDQRGHIFGFVIGFLVIGSYWVSHLRIFRAASHVDRRLIWLNLGFLFWIVATPFASSILGANQPLSGDTVAFFAAIQTGAGGFQLALWVALTRSPLLAPDVSPDIARNVALQLCLAPLIFALSIVVAFVLGPVAAVWFWVLIAVLSRYTLRRYPISEPRI